MICHEERLPTLDQFSTRGSEGCAVLYCDRTKFPRLENGGFHCKYFEISLGIISARKNREALDNVRGARCGWEAGDEYGNHQYTAPGYLKLQ